MNRFYVILPIRVDELYLQKKNIIKEIAKENNLAAHFPLDEQKKLSLLKTILDIQHSKFVLADLSFERPSCYYELGLAQAINKPTFLMAKENTHIHQVNGIVYFYKNIEEYRKLLRQAIDEFL